MWGERIWTWWSNLHFPSVFIRTASERRHGRALQFLSPQLRGDKEAENPPGGPGRLQEMGGTFRHPNGFFQISFERQGWMLPKSLINDINDIKWWYGNVDTVLFCWISGRTFCRVYIYTHICILNESYIHLLRFRCIGVWTSQVTACVWGSSIVSGRVRCFFSIDL